VKILILGANGMIGHCVFQHLRRRHDVRGTLRQGFTDYRNISFLNAKTAVPNTDITNQKRLTTTIGEYQPDVVVNATGIVKQLSEHYSKANIIEVNALAPHRLAEACASSNARLIQFSTDCVFSGKKGTYSEEDLGDAEDIYGLTKYLGEVSSLHCVTLRTSSIGLEIGHGHGLVEWFLRQKGRVKGFTQAIYSGVTTMELARVVEFIIVHHRSMNGLWQVSSEPISKYQLLTSLSAKLGRTDIEIEPDDSFVCDRSLQSQRFKDYTGYRIPNWQSMLKDLADRIVGRANKGEM